MGDARRRGRHGSATFGRVLGDEMRKARNTSPVDVLRDTYRRLVDRSPRDGWDVDLTAAARLDDPKLAPLASWARSCLADPDHPRVIRLSRAAVTSLAALCGLDWFRLVGRLPTAPMSTRDRPGGGTGGSQVS